MMKVSGINDLYRMYIGDLKGNYDLNYISIPGDYEPITERPFDREEMNQLYRLGYEMALKGVKWQSGLPKTIRDDLESFQN